MRLHLVGEFRGSGPSGLTGTVDDVVVAKLFHGAGKDDATGEETFEELAFHFHFDWTKWEGMLEGKIRTIQIGSIYGFSIRKKIDR